VEQFVRDDTPQLAGFAREFGIESHFPFAQVAGRMDFAALSRSTSDPTTPCAQFGAEGPPDGLAVEPPQPLQGGG